MARRASASPIPLDRRQEIFLALVEAQDKGASVVDSRTDTAKKFEVSPNQIQEIEREGLENDWPPLG
jgi:hypothetical protein